MFDLEKFRYYTIDWQDHTTAARKYAQPQGQKEIEVQGVNLNTQQGFGFEEQKEENDIDMPF
jgi:hypothetical protein